MGKSRSRFVVLVGLIVSLMLMASNSAMAMGMGDKISLTPEKQTIYDSIMKEHNIKIETLKINLWGKETEINALKGNPKVEPDVISKIIKEATDLKLQIKVAEEALSEALKKELGITVTKGGMCPMMGQGMMGQGMMGQGMMGQGMMGQGMKNMKGSMMNMNMSGEHKEPMSESMPSENDKVDTDAHPAKPAAEHNMTPVKKQ